LTVFLLSGKTKKARQATKVQRQDKVIPKYEKPVIKIGSIGDDDVQLMLCCCSELKKKYQG
jgi:hypothetical protein